MHCRYNHLLPLFLLVASLSGLNAQSIITGKVTNPEGEPLIGASITARQALSTTTTDLGGMSSRACAAGYCKLCHPLTSEIKPYLDGETPGEFRLCSWNTVEEQKASPSLVCNAIQDATSG